MDIVDIVAAAVRTLVSDTERLGISWTLKTGSVSTSSPLAVVCDGDSVAVLANSMIGLVPGAARVYVIVVPPAGHYIIGYVGETNQLLGTAGMGTMDFVNATTSAGPVTAETVILISDVMTWQAGRAYSATFRQYNRAAGGSSGALFNLRSGGLTGPMLETVLALGSGDNNIEWEVIFSNNSTNTFTGTLALTMQSIGGVGTVLGLVTSGIPRWLLIQDIGLASDFPNVPQIT
jgi:hypothetical protein